MDKNPHDKVKQEKGGVYIGGDVSDSNIVGRDFIQHFYNTLPVPDIIKNNAKLVTAIYAAICEILAILATFGDIRQWQMQEFPPMFTPASWQENLPLPSAIEVIGMFLKNNILFFGLGMVVAVGIIAMLGYMQKNQLSLSQVIRNAISRMVEIGTQVTTTNAQQNHQDIVSKLEKLATLHKDGALTDIEFKEAKRNLLRPKE